MAPNTEPAALPETTRKKPRLAFAIATVFGVGYAPKAPGTFGSLVGVIISSLLVPLEFEVMIGMSRGLLPGFRNQPPMTLPFTLIPVLVTLFLALIGVWSASRVSKYTGLHDPQYVVIDEVSGQHLTLLLGLVPVFLPALMPCDADYAGQDSDLLFRLLSWKSLLLGFLLFRLFDIWKPYPIRWLEKLPGGWGIMADDWLAGVYAAIVLRVAVQLLHL